MFTNTRYSNETLVENIIYFCLLAISFSLPFDSAITAILVQVLVILALVDSTLAKKVKLKFCKTIFLLLIFFGIAGISLFNSPDFAASLYNFQVIVPQYIVVYWLIISYVNTSEKIYGVFLAILLSTFFVSSYGVFQYFFTQNPTMEQLVDSAYFPMVKNRVQSTLGNPNILASFLVMIISFCVGLLLNKLNFLPKAAAFLLTATSFICLLFTFSRGMWLSLFLVVICLSIAVKRKLLYFLIPIFAFAFWSNENFIIERFMSSFQGNDTSALLRFAIWESTLAMIKNHPLTGIGWGAYKFVYPEYDFFVNNKDVIIYHAHNMYLNIAAELGIIALVVFIILLSIHFFYAYNTFKSALLDGQRACGLGLCAVFLSVLLSGVTDYTLFNANAATIFWVFSAMSFVLYENMTTN